MGEICDTIRTIPGTENAPIRFKDNDSCKICKGEDHKFHNCPWKKDPDVNSHYGAADDKE
jgi:hypothetical protein